MDRPKPDMRSHSDNYETCSPGDMRPKEVCRQGHGRKDLEKALPAEHGEQTLSFPTRQCQGVVFSIWFHIWNQPDAHCKELMRPAPIASGRRPFGDTVFQTLSSSPDGSPFFSCASLDIPTGL